MDITYNGGTAKQLVHSTINQEAEKENASVQLTYWFLFILKLPPMGCSTTFRVICLAQLYLSGNFFTHMPRGVFHRRF